MSKPLDYSKWDKFEDSSDDDGPPPDKARLARSAAQAAASQPGSAAVGEVPETCDYSETELLRMQEYEVERPERLNQLLARALDCMERDIEAESLESLATSEAVPLFTTVRLHLPRRASFRLTSAFRQTRASLQAAWLVRENTADAPLNARRSSRKAKRRCSSSTPAAACRRFLTGTPW